MAFHRVQDNVLVGKSIISPKLNILHERIGPIGQGEGMRIFIDDKAIVFINGLCVVTPHVKAVGKAIEIHLFWMCFHLFWIELLGMHVIANTVQGIRQGRPIGILCGCIDPKISHVSKVVHG